MEHSLENPIVAGLRVITVEIVIDIFQMRQAVLHVGRRKEGLTSH